jgi:hypothetical protein
VGEALFVIVVVALLAVAAAVPAGLAVVVFVATRALARPGGQRWLAGVVLAGALVAVAAGVALATGGLSSYPDTRCPSVYPGSRNLEAARIEQSAGFWPPGLRCRYEFAGGQVETYQHGFDGAWAAAAVAAVFGAAMGTVVVGRLRWPAWPVPRPMTSSARPAPVIER